MIIMYSVGCLLFGLIAWEESVEVQAYVAPEYERKDITGILSGEEFSDSDYRVLFEQTGLGKIAIDDLMKRVDGIDTILRHQDNFFRKPVIACGSIFITTREEITVDEKGGLVKAYELAPLRDGYILLTKATHFFGWRYGHAALVVDAIKGTTLEAVMVGENSSFQNAEGWRYYPSFIMLKLRDGTEETMDQIVEFAKVHMYDIPYSITTGIIGGKFSDEGAINGTQCAHLIWNSFYKYGYDIDSDQGGLVTPKDIANSPLFEIVQVYGVDIDDVWK